MKKYSVFILLFVFTCSLEVYSQSVDTTKVLVTPAILTDSSQFDSVVTIKDTVSVDSLKTAEKKIDSIIKTPVVAPAIEVTKDTTLLKEKRGFAFSINKHDSTFYSKMLSIGFGPTFLNFEDPLPSYWKNSVGISVGYSEAITKWLRFNINLDYVNYKLDKTKYLDKFSSDLRNQLETDQTYFSSEKRTQNPTAVQDEINSIVDTNRSFADKYISFRDNNLGVVQLGIGLQIRPINNYWIQPYALLGFNVNLTTNSLILLSSELGTVKDSTKTKVYDDGIGDYVDKMTYFYKPAMTYKHVVYANNSIDGSFGLMFGFGCDVFISPRFGVYGEFRRNVGNNAWKEDYGSFQYGINTIRFGIKYRIKN